MSQPYFVDQTIWQAFREEAESWLGTPYRHLQRCKGRGADCTLFVGQVMLDRGILTHLSYDYYPRDWHQYTQTEYVLTGMRHHVSTAMRAGIMLEALPLGTPFFRGDWLVFATTARNVSNHCGLVWSAESPLSGSHTASVSHSAPLQGVRSQALEPRPVPTQDMGTQSVQPQVSPSQSVRPQSAERLRLLHAINDRGVSFAPLGTWWQRRLRHHFRLVRSE